MKQPYLPSHAHSNPNGPNTTIFSERDQFLLLQTTELGYPPNASRIMATLLGTAVWASSLPSNSMET